MKRNLNNHFNVLVLALTLTSEQQTVNDNGEEENEVREWKHVIRTWAGGRDGQRAIDWTIAAFKQERNTTSNKRKLSDLLEETYRRIINGDELDKNGAWWKRASISNR